MAVPADPRQDPGYWNNVASDAIELTVNNITVPQLQALGEGLGACDGHEVSPLKVLILKTPMLTEISDIAMGCPLPNLETLVIKGNTSPIPIKVTMDTAPNLKTVMVHKSFIDRTQQTVSKHITVTSCEENRYC